MTSAKLNATGMRWVADLSAFDFELKYRPGKSNGDADGLSRNPMELEELERVCTERCDRMSLAAILAGPEEVTCAAISTDLLQFPSATDSQKSPLSAEELHRAQVEDVDVGPVLKFVTLGTRPSRKKW